MRDLDFSVASDEGTIVGGTEAAMDHDEAMMAAALRGVYGRDVEIMGDRPIEPTVLIHFGDHAEAIARESFTRGSPLDGELRYTSGSQYETPGYNFAIDAADEDALLSMSQHDFGGSRTQAVVFRGTGVRMRHYDDFVQIVFWGPGVEGPFVRLRAVDVELDEDGFPLDDREPHEWSWCVVDQAGEPIGEPTGLMDALTAAEAILERPTSEQRMWLPTPV